jgi:CelD/BcsL family acetyltransferase involved in cellulose biosynthesis
VRIVELTDRECVSRLGNEWRALQERCRDVSPYQTWEWNDAWWRHFGARKRPCVLLLYADRTDLVAIAPLYTSWHLRTPLRRLAWMGTGLSDYLGPLIAQAHEQEAARALLAHIDSGLRGWDLADLQQLRPISPLLALAPKPLPYRPDESQCVLPMEACPYLALPPTWEDLTRRLGKKMRSNLGYYERLLFKTFPDAAYSLADATTLDAGMTAFFELHQNRWNARWLPGVLANRRVQAFHREVAARFLDRGWLRLHLLRIGGEIRSALYCFAFGGRTYYYLGGFAPDLAKYSLGTLLTAQAIREAIREGSTEFDFLRGNEPYKYRWLPDERMNHRLLLLRCRAGLGGLGELPGRAGFALNRVERYVEHRAKAFSEQQGRKDAGARTASADPEGAKPRRFAIRQLRKRGQDPEE